MEGRYDERQVWPTEEYHLVRSDVEVTFPEDDLFSGCAPSR
ncbi:hypothetical protein [Streptomyces sp. ME19-01-6]|nr:hypothetical protein [Streptomyces sp. ME19-01-6]MDX3226332.1 hypothetical protein [Streptomyces sp. ME19-01-6]